MADLLRLRIPRGWVILDNKLYDTEPRPEGDDSIENWDEGFIEDVLWIQQYTIADGGSGYKIPKQDFFSIDISWLPDSNINGQYYATLSWCGEEMINIEQFKSKDRYQIRDKIEFWMEDMLLNYAMYKDRIRRLE